MSLKITKAGMLDSIQDSGRFGYRHLGINPTGVMDLFSANLANILVGNPMEQAVVELHYPASEILFTSPAIMCITGGDFTPSINGEVIPMRKPVWVAAETTLGFNRPVKGARSYLAVRGGLQVREWLESASTHFKASAGGWNGRKLLKDDVIPVHGSSSYVPRMPGQRFEILLREETQTETNDSDPVILVLPGKEWPWLTEDARQQIATKTFTITHQSDRMGYKLKGPDLQKEIQDELVSAPVTFGTIQLLPDGSLIILMADHQTTGGYPVVGNVITAHHSKLAQKGPGDDLQFQLTDLRTAEELWLAQQEYLYRLQQDYSIKLNQCLERNN